MYKNINSNLVKCLANKYDNNEYFLLEDENDPFNFILDDTIDPNNIIYLNHDCLRTFLNVFDGY